MSKKTDIINTAISEAKGAFFTVTFIKADKSTRIMNCRTGVKKHLKGGDATYNAKGDNTIGVYDVVTGGYRCFKAENVISLKVNGYTLDFSGDKK